MLQDLMQHHAGHSVIWLSVGAHCRTNFSFEQRRCALREKFMRTNCDRQLMTDPCNFALRRLVGNFEARTCWRERLR
jgi:hypothetical protein